MTHELRRLMPRQYADWQGRYMFDGDAQQFWRDCRVLDISSAGAGLELLDTDPREAEGTSILISVHLRGEVRNARPTKDSRLRVGTQFLDLTPAHHAYLTSLTSLNAYW